MSDFENTLTLPTLTGSEKQITWAATIRGELLARVAELRPQIESALAAAPAAMAATIERGLARLANIDEARFWIDNRGAGATPAGIRTLLQRVAALPETMDCPRCGTRYAVGASAVTRESFDAHVRTCTRQPRS